MAREPRSEVAITRPRGGVAVVSPHLDDGVLGCGNVLAAHPGSTVITVFAGRPPRRDRLTGWDRASGFTADVDVVAARREEDRAALRLLGAIPLWLDFLDAQYGDPPAVAALTAALDAALRAVRPRVVLVPLGLFHSDHELASQAVLPLLAVHGSLTWFAYEEAMYRTVPGLVPERLAELGTSGLELARAALASGPACGLKRLAVAHYRSQLRALGRSRYVDAFEEERYWRVAA